MARNGSGTMTPSVDFTTEAASPPIEIAKLDTALDDVAAEITNSIAADGQTNPSANLKMNGFRLTNLGAATALTDAARVSELIDQDHIYYVDSGSANTYAITPSPAIAAYEEGQRFVVRIANASSGASTLNVNGLGAVAIQTADASAVATGTLAAGGVYEFTYDANATPDRWVVTSPTSKIADGMLSSNIPQKDDSNDFTGVEQTIIAANGAFGQWRLENSSGSARGTFTFSDAGSGFLENSVYLGSTAAISLHLIVNSTAALTIGSDANFDFKAGTVTTNNASASEVGFKGTPVNEQNGDYTLVLTDAGKTIYKASGGAGETITIPANGSVAFPIGTRIWVDNDGGGDLSIAITSDTLENAAGATGTRTIADNVTVELRKLTATKWRLIGAST